MDIRDLSGRTAMVTGAASGIGRAFVHQLAERGAGIFACDVDAEGLASLRNEEGERILLAEVVDVSDADAMSSFAEKVHGQVEAVDLLVNNAGVAVSGLVHEVPLSDWRWLVGVNVWGVIHGHHFFLPPMLERGQGGHVINVASVVSFAGMPGSVPYGMSKWAVRGLSESTWAELHHHGIGVTAVCPGFVQTQILEGTRFSGWADQEDFRDELDRTFRAVSASPERVVTAALRGVQRGRRIVPVTGFAWFMWFASRWCPGLLARLIRYGIERRLRQAG